MQNQRFPWIALVAVGSVALLAMFLSRSDTGREALEPGTRSPDGRGSASALPPGSVGRTSSRPMGSETAASAEAARRDLRVVPRAVRLSESAERLVRSIEPRIAEFEESSRTADLPDERGALDREFIELEELQDVEEALDLVELEEELRGADRSAVMHSKLAAALSQRSSGGRR